jgi:hypothetical protein
MDNDAQLYRESETNPDTLPASDTPPPEPDEGAIDIDEAPSAGITGVAYDNE